MKVIHGALLLLLCCIPSRAQCTNEVMRELRVGVMDVPPFLLYQDGFITGLSAEIWHNIADSLKIHSTYIYYRNPDSLLNDLRREKLDITIAPVSVSGNRLHYMRFTIPYYISDLGLAQKISTTPVLFQAIKNVFTLKTFRYILASLPFILIIATLIWLTERKKNPGNFRSGWRGILDGVYWAVVTMMTVGYGDITPKTLQGRFIAIFWMFCGIGVLFVLTGVISAELTFIKLQNKEISLDKLRQQKVGTINLTGYAELLSKQGIHYRTCPDVRAGLRGLVNDTLDAFIHDRTILRAIIEMYDLKNEIEIQSCGTSSLIIGFATQSKNTELIDSINPVLLDIIESESYRLLLRKFLPED